MTTTTSRTTKFILPLVFQGAPNPSVIINVELREVTNSKNSNFGKVSIYTDSHYEPLNFSTYMSVEEATKIVEAVGCIAVKQDFDQYSIIDLKEIKHLLSAEWIEWFNAANEAYK